MTKTIAPFAPSLFDFADTSFGAPYDYSDIEPATQDWLKARESELFSLRHRTLEDMIRMGQIYTAVQLRLPDRQFKGWIASTAVASRSTVYRLMDVANAFGGYALSHRETHRITPNALYALSQPSVPPKAREFALTSANLGQRVTCQDAKAIMAGGYPL